LTTSPRVRIVADTLDLNNVPINPAPPDVARVKSALSERGLKRSLGTGQQAMMAMGGAIGTGLFLGSGLAVGTAGPGVVLSYAIAAAMALLLGRALTEMAVHRPTAGSFGVYAGDYVSAFAGYAVRVSYWLMQVIATGGHMVAVSIYMQFWFPAVPAALWIVGFSAALVYLNTREVGSFGTFEYWFAMIKVAAIVLFVILGTALALGLTGEPAVGTRHLLGHGGFLPKGWSGVWLAVCFVIYSFIGVEIVAITSGEAKDPERTIPRAMRRMIGALCALYLVTVTLLVTLMPWSQAGVGESPFVTVLTSVGVPAAASVMNFVVLSAALSGANANLYLITRTLFSLARAGFAPPQLGRLDHNGIPRAALLASSLGLGAAVLVQTVWPDSAYVWFFGVALFGGLFVWFMIFVTHLRFPVVPAYGDNIRHRVTSVVGALLVVAVFVSTWWIPGLRATILAGAPWLLLLAVGYALTKRSQASSTPRQSS
jgi:AAT family amino acid transporter